MTDPQSDLLDKIRQQFDSSPYPRIPLDRSPQDNPNDLYIHNLVSSFYLRNQKVVDTQGKLILDAGCGTGYKSLMLALANPGAQIVGVDISAESVRLAEQRLKYHGFDNFEFYVLSLENLTELGYQFDYINCDETLYLLPEPSVILREMRAVLKPEGIIRTNLHSAIQRANFFRAQKLFSLMGLMDSNPEDLEIGIAVDTMEALKDNVLLKSQTWKPLYLGESGKGELLSNHLLQGDKGFTVPEMFKALESSGLEFISMVQWRKWDFRDLFKEPDNLPEYLDMNLPDLTIEQRLHIYELINPMHRLLDFWCGHPEQTQSSEPLVKWSASDWQNAVVHIHPQLNSPKFREDLLGSINACRSLELSNHLSTNGLTAVTVDSSVAISLLPLLDSPQSLVSLAERWRQCRPINPITLNATSSEYAFDLIQKIVLQLERMDYLMVERQF